MIGRGNFLATNSTVVVNLYAFYPCIHTRIIWEGFFPEAIKCVYVVESIKLFAQLDFNTRVLCAIAVFVLQFEMSVEMRNCCSLLAITLSLVCLSYCRYYMKR
jgi:hypothetical protein